MTTFKITTNQFNKHSSKPTNISAESINTKTPVELTLTQLAETVCQPNGKTWCPAIFKDNKRKNDQWLEQQIFALDFDNGTTPEEAIETLGTYGITPNMVYGSFSDSAELRKFRLIFLLDTVITNADTAKWIIVQLMNLFGQKADKACKDLSRMFFGSKYSEPEFFNETPVDTVKLMDVLNTVAIANDSNKTRNVVDPKTVCKGDNPIYIEDNHPCGQKAEGVFNEGKVVEHFDFEKAASNVQIFADFLEGKWLTHPQLFGIATSMRWVKGGMQLMRDTMNKFNAERKTFYSSNNFGILTYVAKMQYTPTNLSNYSPYEEDAAYSNIIFAAKAIRGTISAVRTEEEITVDEAYDKMMTKFSEILENREKGKVFIIRVPTGLGKSELLSQLKVDANGEYGVKSATIAFPTHTLKNEIADRFAKNGTVVKTTPELPEFSAEIGRKLQALYDKGLYSDVNSLVKEISRNPKEHKKVKTKFFTGQLREMVAVYEESDVELAKQYVKANNECYNETSNIVLTTHTKATFVNFASDLMIYDECPLQQVLSIGSIDANEIKIIARNLPEGEDRLKNALEKLYTRLVDIAIETEFRKMETIGLLAEKRDVIRDVILDSKNNITHSSFLQFIDASHYILNANNTIDFVCRRDFQGIEDKTIIIMSATAATSVYENLGIPCQVIDLGKVKMTGRIIQDTTYTCSRESLTSNIGKLVAKVGDLPVITFSSMKSYFNNPVNEMHFGNCAGYDGLKGKDIAVVGTFNRPAFVYALMANALGADVSTSGLVPTIKTVSYNNYNFSLNTFTNELMTRIQLDLINQELVQAVGRSRTLRENCTVNLYSGFPLRETTEFVKSKYK